MSRFDGKVVFVTGAGRGQGRAHALGFARGGARVIATDICKPVDSAPYPMAEMDDLDETVRLVQEAGGEIHADVADVRDLAAMTEVVNEGVAKFGRLDIILANAGICTFGQLATMTEEMWSEMIDIDLSGVWKTVRAGVQHIIDGGRGGAIVLTSSTAGLKGMNAIGHYSAAKHGVTGLAKCLARELAPHNIRVNSIHPTNCHTVMMENPGVYQAFRPDLEDPQFDDAFSSYGSIHLLEDVAWIEPSDVTDAIMYMASDTGRFMTGSAMTLDAGMLQK